MGLFEQALTNSWLRKRQDKTDEEIAALKEEIVKLKEVDSELKDNIDNEAFRQDEALKKSIST